MKTTVIVLSVLAYLGLNVYCMGSRDGSIKQFWGRNGKVFVCLYFFLGVLIEIGGVVLFLAFLLLSKAIDKLGPPQAS